MGLRTMSDWAATLEHVAKVAAIVLGVFGRTGVSVGPGSAALSLQLIYLIRLIPTGRGDILSSLMWC